MPEAVPQLEPQSASVRWTAASASALPKPKYGFGSWPVKPSPRAVSCRMARASSGVSEASAWSISATVPARCGLAIEVPCWPW